MTRYLEVQQLHEASHVQVIEAKHAALKLREGKIYELMFGRMNDGWDMEDYHVINEIGQRLSAFSFFKCKLLLEVA